MSNRVLYVLFFLGLGVIVAGVLLIGALLLLPHPASAEPGSPPATNTPAAIPTDIPVTPTTGPTPSPATPAVGGPVACTNRAEFVTDVSIPDGTAIRPNTAFVKTWRLRNSGTCTWTRSYALLFAGGSAMNGPSQQPLPAEVAPGQAIDLSVSLIAPPAAGPYQGDWLLRSADGALFGVGDAGDKAFWVKITSGDNPVPTRIPPTAAPTSRPPNTATPVPTATTVPTISEWKGEYYGSINLTGTPIVRNDTNVDFAWKNGSPDSHIAADNFSARWTRTLNFTAGTYRFTAAADDGVRVYVDGVLIIDQWHDGLLHTHTKDITLIGGSHAVKVEYYEHTGDATVKVSWAPLGAEAYPDWKGEYWANRKLNDSPVLVRNDKTIDFNWGTKSPGTGIPEDSFSARWTRNLRFDGGIYRFNATIDDGVRIWIDDKLILDDWKDGGIRTKSVDVFVAAGKHDIRVEYYENTGAASIKVWWTLTATPTPSPTPTKTPTPTPTGTPTPTTITGVVWHDLCSVTGQTGTTPPAGCVLVNGKYQADGVLNAGEAGISGIVVSVSNKNCSNPTLQTVTTNSTGVYTFTGLKGGTYCVSISLANTQNATALGSGLWTYPATTGSALIAVKQGRTVSAVNFGWDYTLLP